MGGLKPRFRTAQVKAELVEESRFERVLRAMASATPAAKLCAGLAGVIACATLSWAVGPGPWGIVAFIAEAAAACVVLSVWMNAADLLKHGAGALPQVMAPMAIFAVVAAPFLLAALAALAAGFLVPGP